MAVTAPSVTDGIPKYHMEPYMEVNASGTALIINPGDYVAASGNYAISTHDGDAFWKASGLGVALERNPAFDWAGRQVVNSALLLVAGDFTLRVSANFSGQCAYGVLAYPDSTGSGVNAASGVTGLGALWNTAAPSTTKPQAITYDYRQLASAISAYVTYSASGSALLPGSGLLSANAVSAQVNGVAQVIAWYNTGPAGTGQMDIRFWSRNADHY